MLIFIFLFGEIL